MRTDCGVLHREEQRQPANDRQRQASHVYRHANDERLGFLFRRFLFAYWRDRLFHSGWGREQESCPRDSLCWSSDFDFDLPDDLIAQTAAPRGESRLLVLDRASGGLSHRSIADLPGLLRAGDLLVVNNTRVFAARLLGHRVPSGGAVECLLLELGRAVPACLIDGGECWKR